MSTRVQLEIFEGPLDLLLHLIKKNEVSITDIPIALITAAAILAGTIARFGYAQSYQQDLERHLGRHPELAAAFQRNWLLRRVTRKSRR